RLRMAAAPPGTALRLARIPGVGGGVLDEGDDSRLHEAAGADRLAGAGHLGDLDHPADGADLHLAPGAGGVDLVCPHPVAGVDHHLDLLIALAAVMIVLTAAGSLALSGH